jgi:hypothetical protein
MSLKCSLFGHNYGNSEVRRDREQDGNELVETIQEVKLCDRCDEHLVISETTEVTTVQTAEGGETDADTGDSEASATGDSRGTPRDAGMTGPPGDRSNNRSDAGEAAPETDTPRGDSVDTPGGPRAGGAPERPGGPGHDPPEQEIPPARKDDAVIIDEDGEEKPVTEWPQGEEGDEQETDWEPETAPASGSDTDGRERPTRSTGGLTVPEGEFYCPECEFSTAVESSSLREGDFCPECHRGALEHHDT